MDIDINKVEWEDIFGNPVGTTEERFKKLSPEEQGVQVKKNWNKYMKDK